MSDDGVVDRVDASSCFPGCGNSHKDPAMSKVAAATFTMCLGLSIVFTVMRGSNSARDTCGAIAAWANSAYRDLVRFLSHALSRSCAVPKQLA